MLIAMAQRLAAVACLGMLLCAPAAGAGLSGDGACRKALATGVRRVTRPALKGIERGHRDRMRGNLPPESDCNDPAQRPGSAASRLQRAVEKLSSLAARGCEDASAPTSVGFDPCPAPCGAVAI